MGLVSGLTSVREAKNLVSDLEVFALSLICMRTKLFDDARELDAHGLRGGCLGWERVEALSL